MKLRSGKVVGAKIRKLSEGADDDRILAEVVVTPTIKTELAGTIGKLKNLLIGNKKFATLLIEKLLLLGKDNDDPSKKVFQDEINKLIRTEYPAVRLSREGEEDDLLTVAYKLGSLIYGDHALVREEFTKQPRSKWEAYKNILRDKIEKEVVEEFSAVKQEEVEVIGSDLLSDSGDI